MKEEQILLNLDLKKEQQRQGLAQPEGIKLFLFRALYSILPHYGLNRFSDILFTFFLFIQLMAFPMDKVFSSGWKNYWFNSVGNFIRYFQLIFLWEGNYPFFLIIYIVVCIYYIILLFTFIHIILESNTLSYKSKFSTKLIATLLEYQMILSIPFLRTLFAVFSCENDGLKFAPEFKCKTGIHLCLIILSIIFILLHVILNYIFNTTLFEFGANNFIFRAAYTSSTQVLLEIIKIIIIILYQFIKNELILSIITFVLSLILLIDFLNKQPFSNGFTMKIYFMLYLIFFWSCTTCIIAILLKNTKFEGGVVLLIIGYPILIFATLTKKWEYSFDKIFEYSLNKNKDGYIALLDIEFFLKLEDSLEDKIRTREHKVLYSYIKNYESNCTLSDCPLKQFMRIPLKIENFVEMKVCLLQHAELLYKNAVSRYPFNAKLRISYGLFLYKKLNKKLKGINEIALLNSFNTNLEDSFLVYKAQRFIQDESEGIIAINNVNNGQNEGISNSVVYKYLLNNIKSLISKITLNYIDFWTILALSDENKSENFQKMSRLGAKIRKLTEELKENVEQLENVNFYDQDTVKLYMQFMIEVLNNNNQANVYANKLSENEQKKHQYNEDNLFELNYKAMSKNEDYKYIIINCSLSKFYTIYNLSLSTCQIFGYTKEELIGHPFDILLPEIFCANHRQMIEHKLEEFKKKLLIKNVKMRSDSWIEDSFGRNKMKYLVHFKVRWTLVSSEEEIIYGIGKIINESKSLVALEQEVVYVLTDKDLIIKSFTSNGPKILLLHSSAINNNLDITEFIREFNEDCIPHEENDDNIKESTISNISIIKKKVRKGKVDILKKNFIGNGKRRIIHWKLGDLFVNENKGQKNSIFAKRSSFAKISFNESKFQSALIDYGGKNRQKNKIIPRKKISVSTTNLNEIVTSTSKELYTSNTDDKLPTLDQEKIIDFKEINIPEFDILGDKNSKDRFSFLRTVHHKFYLTVKEVKINENKVGYLFKFEPTNNKGFEEKESSNINKNGQYISKYEISSAKPEMNDIDKSEISVVSFANKQSLEQKNSLVNATPENPFGLSCENNDSYFMKMNKEKENEFTLDINNMSYKQLGLNGLNEKSEGYEFYEVLKQEAVEKVSKASKLIKKEEVSEEEEESSSGSYYSIDENSKNSSEDSSEKKDESSQQSNKNVISQEFSSSKKNEIISIDNKNASNKGSNKNIPVITITPSPTPSTKGPLFNLGQLSSLNANQKNKEEDYFHVNMSNITFFRYNYTTGFVEVIKDQKFKTSQVVKQINAEKEKLGKMNAKYITNPKLAKEKKRGNTNKKSSNDDDESNSFNENTIKLKEIQRALTSKEKQKSIIYLCIFSFLIFFLIIGSSIMSILISFHLRNETFVFYSLIRSTIRLYKNILLEINFVREMLIIDSPYYNNFYDKDKEAYFRNYSNQCYEYYLDTSYILSNITTSLNVLNAKQKSLIAEKKINLYIIDPIKSKTINKWPKLYNLLVYSGYYELNSALYHISQLKEKEIYTYDDYIYFFIKNGMSNLLMCSKEQMQILTNEFYSVVQKGHIEIIICLVALFIVYVGCFFIFKHYHEKVEERKQSYLSVFYEIGGQFIILSLTKCEKFSQKLQIQEETVAGQGEKVSLDSSSIDESFIDNDIQASSNIKLNKDNNKINTIIKDKNKKGSPFSQMKIIGLIIFLVLLVWQYASYIYYYERISLYKNCIQYEYFITEYTSSFIFPFIAVREYIYDPTKTFYNTPVSEYIDNTLQKFYVELANVYDSQDKYIKYFPQSYSTYINYLCSEEICQFISDFINEYPYNGYKDCKDFFYGTSDYGFLSLLTSYIEEIRLLRDDVKEYIILSKEKGYKYNESFLNDPDGYYESLIYNNYSDVIEDYKALNPVNTLNSTLHKTTIIVFRFIISKVIILSLDMLFHTFDEMILLTTRVSLIINIAFMFIVTVGFCMFWLPFIMKENETIFKTKNMLSIIPNEILINLPHINIMLGVDEEHN